MTPVIVFLIGIGMIAVAIGLLTLREAHEPSGATRNISKSPGGMPEFLVHAHTSSCIASISPGGSEADSHVVDKHPRDRV
jgi:hypothetical protein